ncbi:MAG: serine hydroxymethyltransferase, partial [Bacteroidetes bacterium]|nr:serine hydroxymethyltransferase [Bacteroidota bacterium]
MNHIKAQDLELYQVLNQETTRQNDNLELIASENFASKAVMEANGCTLTNKYAEGYP